MKIKRLVIENFKSIERIELIEPNPFTVFVGPNGSGKSNIFEALEFVNLSYRINDLAASLFGGKTEYVNWHNSKSDVSFTVDLESVTINLKKEEKGDNYESEAKQNKEKFRIGDFKLADEFYDSFSRIFVKNTDLQKLPLTDDRRLSLAATNLEKVLKRVLTNDVLKNEIFEWLDLFVPEFKSVEVIANPFNGEETLLWHEQFSEKPFTKQLISDGTFNILAMLIAVYQSDDKPQFLCIEEPENGLNPKVIKEFVNLCRYVCEEFGHFIWLNTHSQTLVSQLTPEEIVLVDKKEGATQIKQIKGMDLHGLPMDEAWLSNALGGGLPW